MPRSFLVKKSKSERTSNSAVDLDDVYYSFTPSPVSPISVSTEAISVSAVTPYTPTLLPLTVSTGYVEDIGSPSLPETSYSGASDVEVDGESSAIDVIRHPSTTSGSQPCRASPPVSDTCSDESLVEEREHHSAPHTHTHTHSHSHNAVEVAEACPSNCNNSSTVEYTYEAFFVTDGRSKKKKTKEVCHDGPEDLSVDRSRGRYTCNECGKNYATSSNLSRHKQTHRSLDSQQAKKCPHCNKIYVSMPALSMHILTHELRHLCTVCNKSFSRPWLLQGHMRSHTGEKPYGCAHCGKAFADRSNLRAHMQTHSAFKHFECQRCHKSFALKSYLNKHYESACIKDVE